MKIAASLIATLALAAATFAAPDNKHGNKNNNKPIVINKKVLQTAKVPFIPHTVSPESKRDFVSEDPLHP